MWLSARACQTVVCGGVPDNLEMSSEESPFYDSDVDPLWTPSSETRKGSEDLIKSWVTGGSSKKFKQKISPRSKKPSQKVVDATKSHPLVPKFKNCVSKKLKLMADVKSDKKEVPSSSAQTVSPSGTPSPASGVQLSSTSTVRLASTPSAVANLQMPDHRSMPSYATIPVAAVTSPVAAVTSPVAPVTSPVAAASGMQLSSTSTIRLAPTPSALANLQVPDHRSTPSYAAVTSPVAAVTSPVAPVTCYHLVVVQSSEFTLQLPQPAGGVPVVQLAPLSLRIVTATPVSVQVQQTVEGGDHLSMPLGIGSRVQTSTGQHLLTPTVSTASTDTQHIATPAASTMTSAGSTNSSVHLSPLVTPDPMVGTATDVCGAREHVEGM